MKFILVISLFILNAFAFEVDGVSHTAWNSLLQKHVSASGAVDYKGFQNEEAQLQSYLKQLADNAPADSWSDEEKLAYWINLYNAYTVDLILDHYPLKSIRDISEPWDTPIAKVGDKTYSLNQVEHEIVRKRFNEPRIHFAVNCASQSCPELLNKAYTAENLDQLLEQQTKKFINNPKHNEISADQVRISSIFDWYKEDFVKNGTVIDFLNTYSNTEIKENASVGYKDYNWNLNE